MGALTRGDYAHARLPGFERRVSAALETIRMARHIGRIGVCFSGGKDSTVLLDLVRRVDPEAPAAFFDSGCEYPETYEIVKHYGVETIQPQMSLVEMCRYGGYWGHPSPVDVGAPFDFADFLVIEPAERFVARHGLAVVALGLRRQESSMRRISLGRRDRGVLYRLRSGLWRLCPLAHWRLEDIWAYIASRDLRYNAIYDRMADYGIDRVEQRVSTLLGLSALKRTPRYAFLRAVAPDVFWRLAADFPRILEHAGG